MTVDAARKDLIVSSLAITGCQILFLILAPVLNYPLRYPQNIQILQIITPVFLGYLGSAAHFIFRPEPPDVRVQNQLLGLLVKGPLIIYVVTVAGALTAFGYSNRTAATPGDGMSVDHLSTALAICLGILAATTSVISSYLFVTPKEH